jgi:hypothetical protein
MRSSFLLAGFLALAIAAAQAPVGNGTGEPKTGAAKRAKEKR